MRVSPAVTQVAVLGAAFIRNFSCYYDGTSDKISVRKGGFIWACSLGCTVCGDREGMVTEHEAAGHMAPAARRQRTLSSNAQLPSSSPHPFPICFPSSWDCVVLSMGLLTSDRSLGKFLQREP